jgi:hypothetical protein
MAVRDNREGTHEMNTRPNPGEVAQLIQTAAEAVPAAS